MKKLALCLALTCGLFANPHANHSSHNNPSSIADSMHMHMLKEPFKMSDNLEYNFIYNMIPHHKDAIYSSKIILEKSKNKEVIKAAKEIIATQEKEVSDFTKLLEELSQNKTSYSKQEIEKFNKDAAKIMEDMHKDMAQSKSTNLDEEFLKAMISHHKGAVLSSKQILDYTKNEKIIKIAKDIINAQEKEVKSFETMIKAIQKNAHHH